MQGNTGQGVVLLGERTYFDCRSEAWTPWNYAFLQEKIVQKGYLYFTRLVAIYLIGMLIMGLNITCVHYIDYIIQFTISPIHFHTCPTWIWLQTDHGIDSWWADKMNFGGCQNDYSYLCFSISQKYGVEDTEHVQSPRQILCQIQRRSSD